MGALWLDDFSEASGWTAVASGLAELKIGREPGPHGWVLRLDFDFKGGGGFVGVRRAVALEMPASFAFQFALRGRAPSNRFEFKLCDPSGRNVWWHHRDRFEMPHEWQAVRIRSRDVDFAWGPAGGGPVTQVGAIEFILAAGPGGEGTIWIEDLQLEDLTVRAAPIVRASSAQAGHAAHNVLDSDRQRSWRNEPSAAPHWLEIDFQGARELGGIVIDWEAERRAQTFAVQLSGDGVVWTTGYTATQADTERSYVPLLGGETRFLRLVLTTSHADGAFGIVSIDVDALQGARSLVEVFETIARHARPGLYPRYLSRQQSYWTPVGLPDGDTCALLNEEGLVEVGRGSFSIEPFVFVDGALVTWTDVQVTQELEDGSLPIPSVVWRAENFVMRTTVFATPSPRGPVLYIRYRVENTNGVARALRLFAAVRPFQVTPPWQSYHDLGGLSTVGELEGGSGLLRVNRRQLVLALTPAAGFGAVAFEQGDITNVLRNGELPGRSAVTDPFGYASGAWRFDLDVEPFTWADVFLAAPWNEAAADPEREQWFIETGLRGEEKFQRAVKLWSEKMRGLDFDLPENARAYADCVRSASAHILILRDGAALQPGPRRYTRSWIRDGAIMAAALLRVGCAEEAVAFIRWYAKCQRSDGAVPCCVDHNGADALVEHDSHGEFIFTAMDCFRFTGDQAFLAEMWPHVAGAATYLEALRAARLTSEYERIEKRARYGLLPESASHEGYLAHPVHAYWDDFWALRGFADAAEMAEVLGHRGDARRFRESYDSLAAALSRSIQTTMAERGITYVPGSVEWADFDPTATANAITLLGELDRLPRAALEATFERYLTGLRWRRTHDEWANYAPYEIRLIGAFVEMGQRDRAHELARFFLADRRPLAWNQWPEIAWREPRSPAHLGDIPHAWIGAEWVLAVRSMLAYERIADRSLVLCAGIPPAWLAGDQGVSVRDLPTYFGRLSYTLRWEGDNLRLEVWGTLTIPAGKIRLRPPLPGPIVRAELNGKQIGPSDEETVAVDECPARVRIACGPAPD